MKPLIGKFLLYATFFSVLTGCVSSVIGNFSQPPGVSDEQYNADYAECRAVADSVSFGGGVVGYRYMSTLNQCMAGKGYSDE